ncbi:MAG TPA: hypothetical protein P5150_01690 [Candidatus Ratteibacteria bacterium]|nr:hypothetical protein [Candidatus Ratteibacteria bacterium]
MEKEKNSDGDFGLGQLDPFREAIAEVEAEKIQPTPKCRTWGATGKRWEEECECCHRETVIDNATGLCQKCHEHLRGIESRRMKEAGSK